MASAARSFRGLQRRFAAHLRDPRRNAAPPGIERRRLRIYAELFYNNVEGFLANAFPVLRRITPDARWHAMVRDFYSRHVSHEPLFRRIPLEFLKHLERRRIRTDPPFLRELAHYEWVEAELASAPDPALAAGIDPTGDLLSGAPVLSPLARPLQYAWPVHRIGPDFRSRRPPPAPTHLVVWRNADDAVKFMEMNAVTARLLQLTDGRSSGRRLLARMARELRHPEPAAVIAEGAALLESLRQRGIVAGARVLK